jgi:glycosyltransferase involved in cell wall biosynthesis
MIVLYLLLWLIFYKLFSNITIFNNLQENITYISSYNLEHYIYILIPCYNFEKYILKCLLSVKSQNYSKYKCIIINDGSTDKSNNIITSFCKTYEKFLSYNFKENKGPAFSKYTGFLHIKKICQPNDICIVLDGDDYFLNDNVLSIINTTYNNTKCWFTYGSYDGKKVKKPLDITKTNITNYRNNKWCYSHPRSFKTYLLNYFSKEDFLYKKNIWLQKGTDRNFIYKCLEFSGHEKIKYINTKLYYYRSHPLNSQYRISKKEVNNHIYNAKNRKAINKYNEDINIIIYELINLDNILKCIQNQTVLNRIKVHILNNNSNFNFHTDKILKKYSKINITFYSSSEIIISVVLFNYIKMIRKKNFMDYVIIINNEYLISNTYIEEVYKSKKPKSITSWNGGYFDKQNKFIFDLNKITLKDILEYQKYEITTFDYADINYSIIDSSLFDLPILNPVPDIYNIGFWLSMYCSKLNWTIYRSFNIPNNVENNIYKKVSNNNIQYIDKSKKQNYWPIPFTIKTDKIIINNKKYNKKSSKKYKKSKNILLYL